MCKLFKSNKIKVEFGQNGILNQINWADEESL